MDRKVREENYELINKIKRLNAERIETVPEAQEIEHGYRRKRDKDRTNWIQKKNKPTSLTTLSQ